MDMRPTILCTKEEDYSHCGKTIVNSEVKGKIKKKKSGFWE